MRPTRKNQRRVAAPLVLSHLSGIKRALLEGEKRPAFLEYLKQADERRGLYVLYGADGRLHYAGKVLRPAAVGCRVSGWVLSGSMSGFWSYPTWIAPAESMAYPPNVGFVGFL